MFDPNQFLDMQTSEALDTKVIPCPVGEYLAVIDKIAAKSGEKDGKPWTILDVVWDIQDEGVKATLSRDKVLVKQGISLDVTDAGSLDFGKGRNVGLGRLREAVGQNTPGRPWSPNMLPGNMGKVIVGHRPDKNDPSILYAEIKAVTKAG